MLKHEVCAKIQAPNSDLKVCKVEEACLEELHDVQTMSFRHYQQGWIVNR